MKQQFVMNVEPKLIEEIDAIIEKESLYGSRNEFVREALREKVMEFRRLRARKVLKEIGKKAMEKGWNGEMLSKEERNKLADEFLKEKGFLKD